ncbi:MAG: dihydroorotate dehydrogenase electron transfer subunit [Candidatus Hydrogenedens sp.]|jgi:dihydroorotate dehydrogenase electron transfer subunit|nr:dihydroorotate dehydrogenase electron transfer subunit [Candidatus Hydrogenedens sp.]
MTHLLDCTVLSNAEVAPEHRRMILRGEAIARDTQPGQFCMLESNPGLIPFLRRPMSIERSEEDRFSVLYKIVGEGTRLLSKIQPGDTVNVQGPLGKGFPIQPGYERHILVGGGIGIAPLPGLAEALIRQNIATPEVLLAARSRDMLLCEEDFKSLGCSVLLTTDDGSAGMKAFAADALREMKPHEKTVVYVCGPMIMMATVHRLCMETGSLCLASLEAHMACGDSVCMGCVVETTFEEEFRRMVRVCHDGPVFDSRHINWNAGAPVS